VLGPKTVPRLTKALLDAGVMTMEQAMHIHKDHPEKTYHIELNI